MQLIPDIDSAYIDPFRMEKTLLGSMHAGEIFDAKQLPLRYLGFATSFRKEAGTYGKDMEGLIRMHQFDKLKMESLILSRLYLRI